MIIVAFIIAIVVSMPIVAIACVSMASRREDAVYSLGEPARGSLQAAARRIVDFHTETELPRPRDCGRISTPQPALSQARQSRRPVDAGSPKPLVTSKMSVGPAA